MHLTSRQKQVLILYRRYHQKPPTLIWYITVFMGRSAYFVYVGIFLVCLVVLLSPTLLINSVAYSVLGLLFGFILYDFIAFRQMIVLWPVLDGIIDWSKVEILLDSSDQS